MDMSLQRLSVPAESRGERLDVFLSDRLNMTRSQVQKLIRDGFVQCGGEAAPARRVQTGENIEIAVPPPRSSEVVPEPIAIDIIYQDSALVVLNKPRGLTVHPGGGCVSGTLVNALLYHISDLSGIGGVERPGIVHRLDRDTSGIMVVAKNDMAHQSLSAQFNARTIRKEYHALVHGSMEKNEGAIEAPIGRNPVHRKKMMISPHGRYARTCYEVMERLRGFTLVRVKPLTGRTHQIRVHFTSIGHPLAGDEVYGSRKTPFELKGQFLHAASIAFRHPDDGRDMEFSAPLPGEYLAILEILRNTH